MVCAFCHQPKKVFQSIHDGKHPKMWCGRCVEGLKAKMALLKAQAQKK